MPTIHRREQEPQRAGRGPLRFLRALATTFVGLAAVTLLVVVVGAATQAFRLVPVRTGSETPHAPRGSLLLLAEGPGSAPRVRPLHGLPGPNPRPPPRLAPPHPLPPSPPRAPAL